MYLYVFIYTYVYTHTHIYMMPLLHIMEFLRNIPFSSQIKVYVAT